MNFSEKLFKLRKEKGLSQEALAEQLNTTRQAISKWENNQGFPETEKLMQLGNIFNVSIDYLLKTDDVEIDNNQNSYYVSREKAESYLYHENRLARNIALGIGCLLCSGIPYILFTKDSPLSLFSGVIFVLIGLSIILVTSLTDRDYEYKILKQKSLLFDQNYLTELIQRYNRLKKKYIGMFISFFGVILLGGVIFELALNYYNISENILVVCFLPVLALALFMLIYSLSMIDAYELLVYNEEYVNKFSTRLMNKIRHLFK